MIFIHANNINPLQTIVLQQRAIYNMEFPRPLETYSLCSSPCRRVEPALKCPLHFVFIICSQECSSVMPTAAAAGGVN